MQTDITIIGPKKRGRPTGTTRNIKKLVRRPALKIKEGESSHLDEHRKKLRTDNVDILNGQEAVQPRLYK